MINRFPKNFSKKDQLQMYQRTIKNSILDCVSVYSAYRKDCYKFGFTIKELDEYTPDWVLAKYHLINN